MAFGHFACVPMDDDLFDAAGNEPLHGKTNNMYMHAKTKVQISGSSPLFLLQDSTIPLYIQNFQTLIIFCDCTGWFVWNLFKKKHCLFSHEAVQM